MRFTSYLLIYIAAMRSFLGVRFMITSDSVVAVFQPFRYSIPFSDISSVEVVNEFPWYMGWSIWGRKLVFAGKYAKAISIRKDRGFSGLLSSFWKTQMNSGERWGWPPDTFQVTGF